MDKVPKQYDFSFMTEDFVHRTRQLKRLCNTTPPTHFQSGERYKSKKAFQRRKIAVPLLHKRLHGFLQSFYSFFRYFHCLAAQGIIEFYFRFCA